MDKIITRIKDRVDVLMRSNLHGITEKFLCKDVEELEAILNKSRHHSKLDEGEVERFAKKIYEQWGKNNGGWVCSWEELAPPYKDFDKTLVREAASRFSTPKIDREKLAKKLHEMYEHIDVHTKWDELRPQLKKHYLDDADAILTELEVEK